VARSLGSGHGGAVGGAVRAGACLAGFGAGAPARAARARARAGAGVYR